MKRKTTTYHVTEIYHNSTFQPPEHVRVANEKPKSWSKAEKFFWLIAILAVSYFAYGLTHSNPYKFFPVDNTSTPVEY